MANNNKLLLSFAQQKQWLVNQIYSSIYAENILATVHLSGSLNASILEQSLNEIIKRHKYLQTFFVLREQQPVQAVTEIITLKLPIVSLETLTKVEQSAEVKQLIFDELHHKFSLDVPPLIRTKLFQLDKEEYLLILTIHNLISDSLSIQFFLRELTIFYEVLYRKKSDIIPEFKIPYRDFLDQQTQGVSNGFGKTQLEYWEDLLKGNIPLLQLPTKKPRLPIKNFQSAKQSFIFRTYAGTLYIAHCRHKNIHTIISFFL